MIDFYTAATPNCYKVSIALEELQLGYRVIEVNDQLAPELKETFLRLNPTGRLPFIIDHERNGLPIFESGAILLYLAERTGQLLPDDMRLRIKAVQWLMFQMGSLGPTLGQAHYFLSLAHRNLEAAERFQKEGRRLLKVLNEHLATHEFLAEEYSVADIATWPWLRLLDRCGLNLQGLLHVQAWMVRMNLQPACQRGLMVPPRKM